MPPEPLLFDVPEPSVPVPPSEEEPDDPPSSLDDVVVVVVVVVVVDVPVDAPVDAPVDEVPDEEPDDELFDEEEYDEAPRIVCSADVRVRYVGFAAFAMGNRSLA